MNSIPVTRILLKGKNKCLLENFHLIWALPFIWLPASKKVYKNWLMQPATKTFLLNLLKGSQKWFTKVQTQNFFYLKRKKQFYSKTKKRYQELWFSGPAGLSSPIFLSLLKTVILFMQRHPLIYLKQFTQINKSTEQSSFTSFQNVRIVFLFVEVSIVKQVTTCTQVPSLSLILIRPFCVFQYQIKYYKT